MYVHTKVKSSASPIGKLTTLTDFLCNEAFYTPILPNENVCGCSAMEIVCKFHDFDPWVNFAFTQECSLVWFLIPKIGDEKIFVCDGCKISLPHFLYYRLKNHSFANKKLQFLF